MIFDKEDYKAFDPELWNAIDAEAERQQNNIELIASENVVSKAVMAAQGTLLTNKYAEGYPGKRYYGGTDVIDVVESLAIERAKELFGAKFANVQPHSGSQANAAVYMSLIQPGDTVMGMDLSAGGHLTHGAPVSFSGKTYNFVAYNVDKETELLDYDAILAQAKEVQPKLIVAGASAYSRIIDFAKFREIARCCRCLPHGRYGAHCWSCSLWSSSKSSSSCTCDHYNNSQDASWSSRWFDFD